MHCTPTTREDPTTQCCEGASSCFTERCSQAHTPTLVPVVADQSASRVAHSGCQNMCDRSVAVLLRSGSTRKTENKKKRHCASNALQGTRQRSFMSNGSSRGHTSSTGLHMRERHFHHQCNHACWSRRTGNGAVASGGSKESVCTFATIDRSNRQFHRQRSPVLRTVTTTRSSIYPHPTSFRDHNVTGDTVWRSGTLAETNGSVWCVPPKTTCTTF